MAHWMNVTRPIKKLSKKARLLTLDTLINIVNYPSNNKKSQRSLSTWFNKFHNLHYLFCFSNCAITKWHYFVHWIHYHGMCCWTSIFLKLDCQFSFLKGFIHLIIFILNIKEYKLSYWQLKSQYLYLRSLILLYQSNNLILFFFKFWRNL